MQKQITDIDLLRHHLRESVCLCIDTGGCEGIREGITSIGLAMLPPTDFSANRFPTPPFSTEQLVEQYRIESYCLYIEERSRKKPHPPFPFGVSIHTSDPAGEITSIVQKIKQRYPGRDIVLIGWHPHARDYPAIQFLIPALFREVVGWADVLDVMQQTCFSRQEDLARTWPPLGDMMLCVGFGEECVPMRVGHSAGSDAVHTVMILARLLTFGDDELPVEVRRRRLLKQWRQK